MAPPGTIPPGYSYDHVPQSFMVKRPVPAGEDTNTRPILIFISYLTLCFSLTVFIVHKLWKSYVVLSKSTTARKPQRKYVLLFTFLAFASVATTWYHMIQYFRLSYSTWLTWRSYYDLDVKRRHWGLWLKHTSLFKEAWEIVIIGNARYWWSHQIFFFASALGLNLEQKGLPRRIKHTWAFMLLGQIVAISFATNLFLLALILSPPPPPSPSTSGVVRRKWLGPWLFNFVAILATQWSAYLLADEYYWHTWEFMPILLTPHVALLILPFARLVLPTKYSTDEGVDFASHIYKYAWVTTIFGGAMLWLKVTIVAYRYAGFWGILEAIFEHPAVSSVGWDVIFCWISWIAWWRIQGNTISELLDIGNDGKNGSWGNAISAPSVIGSNIHGELRQRAKDD